MERFDKKEITIFHVLIRSSKYLESFFFTEQKRKNKINDYVILYFIHIYIFILFIKF